MADAKRPEGLTIKYQNKDCGVVFDFTRPTGLEPGHGVIYVDLTEFGDYEIKESLSGIDFAPAPGKTQEKKGTAKRGFQSAGDLEFTEIAVEDDGSKKTYTVLWKNILLTERGVESAFAFDDENDLCRIELTDMRELWKTRGSVTEWVNVPKNGVGLPGDKAPSGGGTQERPSNAPSAGSTVGPDSKRGLSINNPPPVRSVNQVSVRAVAALPGSGTPTTSLAGSELFIQGSTNGGKPKTLKEVLTKTVLPALPGQPVLNRMPKDLEDAIPIGHIWTAKLPKECLRELLDEFQLTLALDFDSNVSLWRRGEGPGEKRVILAGADGKPSDEKVIVDTSSASCDQRCATSRKLVNFRWIPTTVVVVGPPVIVTERLRLEPVGEINGTVLPLRDALEAIGLDFDKALRYALTRYTDRTALPFGVTPEGVKEFDRWAFKYFRIPGGADASADKLPILNARGSVTKAGELQPVKVFSESHMVVNIFTALVGKYAASLSGSQIRQGTISGAGRTQAAAANEAAITLLKAAGPSAYLVTHNIPFAEQNSGWDLDSARGILKFNQPQGLCQQDGVSLDTATAILNPTAAVELEFAHTLKPGADDPLELGFRYFSVWLRGSDGKVTLATEIPPGSAPLMIERQELQEIRGIDGQTNKSMLDNFAKKVAETVFSTPQSELGAVATFGRPVPVSNTGQALSVRWYTDGERPRTEVHVNSFGPFHPEPDLRTRAFGLPIGRGRELESPIVPRGVK